MEPKLSIPETLKKYFFSFKNLGAAQKMSIGLLLFFLLALPVSVLVVLNPIKLFSRAEYPITPPVSPPYVTSTPQPTLAINWQTDTVSLQASAFYITVDGRKFYPKPDSGTVSVRSDPGNPLYTTLEVSWWENGVEMRLNIYFNSDGQTWWVDEMRTYNGKRPGDWIYYKGKHLFANPVGETYWISGGLAFYPDNFPKPTAGQSPSYSIYFNDLRVLPRFKGTISPTSTPTPTMLPTCDQEPTSAFVHLHGSGSPSGLLTKGARVEAYNQRGQRAGCFVVLKDGSYAYLRVYGEEEKGDKIIPGMRDGEKVTIKVNGREVRTSPANYYWHDTKLIDTVNLYSTSTAVPSSTPTSSPRATVPPKPTATSTIKPTSTAIPATATPTPISNNNPVISTTSLKKAQLGKSYKFKISGYDLDKDDNLKMVVSNLPLGISFKSCENKVSGIIKKTKTIECTISGTPKKAGTKRVDISLFDNKGGSVQKSLTLKVKHNFWDF